MTQRRLTAVRVIAAIMAASTLGFGIFTIVFGFIGPEQEPHAFHNAVVASLLLVLSAPPAVAVARAPSRPQRALVVLAVLAVAGFGTMLLSLTIDPFTLPFLVLVGVLWALAADRSEILPGGRASPVLLALLIAAALPLSLYGVGQAELQRTDDTSPHAAFFHWVETSFHAFAVLGLGLLAAMRPAVHRMAAWMAGLSMVVLGAASLLFPTHASSLPAAWAAAAIGGGMAFVAVAEWEARRARVTERAAAELSRARPL